jgi:MoaA/NifB/PqqE/SkfB family radical SAM enzyme
MKLDNIGFYTLSEDRARSVSTTSPIMRAEILLTDKCNFKCPYCRGMKNKGELPLSYVQETLENLCDQKLTNVRFSGGEPTLYPFLLQLVKGCKSSGVKRIAISTNGSAKKKFYLDLLNAGVNDFSISLDSGCCSIGDKMTGGVKNSWNTVVDNIKFISKKCYVTIGIVFNEINYNEASQTIKFIDSLGVSDIRIIPSAQYNKALNKLSDLPDNLVNKYPILNYRIQNLKKGRNFRGIQKTDCKKCWLILDDTAISGPYQYPCIIYLREAGNPISKMGADFRERRIEWFKNHNSHNDNICKTNCLDVCCDYNNRVDYYVRKNARNII